MAEMEIDYEARLRAQPETARKIGEFLANPETGVRRARPAPRRTIVDPDPGGYVYPDETTRAQVITQPAEFDDSELNGTI